jgi:predicted P-loop ATPase
LAAAEQAARYAFDAWEEPVREWLTAKDDVSVGEVLVGALGIQQANWSQTAQNRIADILVANGFKKYRPGKVGKPRTPRYRRERLDHQSKKDFTATVTTMPEKCRIGQSRKCWRRARRHQSQ